MNQKVLIKVTSPEHPYYGDIIESSCGYDSLEHAKGDWVEEGEELGWVGPEKGV